MHLVIAGTLRLNGATVSADGGSGWGSHTGGGGAGGSIWISASRVLGYGFISANGGAGPFGAGAEAGV